MIVFGFALIIAAVAAAVILITQNADTLDVHALGQTWTISAYWLVVAGLIATAVAVLGLAMVRQAGVRAHRARQSVVPTAADERLMTTPEYPSAPAPTAADRPARRSLFRHHPTGAS
jgi:hypothetical protein